MESQSLPLVENDWNRLKLAIAGDGLELFLNGRSIHKQALDPANRRTFGLFHYRERTQVRVRNIVWRGEWPRAIPPVFEQQLASQELRFLDDSRQKLQAVFEHDFTADDSPFDRFRVARGDPDHFESSKQGMRVTRPESRSYGNSSISPRIRLSGDFDIAAQFDDLEPKPSAGATGGIYLEVAVNNETSDQFRILLRLERVTSVPRSTIRCVAISNREGDRSVRPFELAVDDSSSGTLRFARRGDKIYLLFAEGDSPNFRLFGVHKTTTDDAYGLELAAQSYLDSETKVSWTQLTVRAEGIESFTADALDEMLKTLNSSRKLLAKQFEHRFGRDQLTDELFRPAGIFALQEDSLLMQKTGTPTWTVSNLGFRPGMQGDFDVELDLEELQFALSSKQGRTSALYFQIDFPDADRTRISFIIARDSGDNWIVYMQDRVSDRESEIGYRKSRYAKTALDKSDLVSKLRIARRGKRVYFLYRLPKSETDRILTYRDYTDLPVLADSLRILLHSGREGEVSSVKLKSLRVAAEAIFPDPDQLQPPSDDD
jgi:hypothetical protein